MVDLHAQFNEALASLKAKATVAKYSEVVAEYSKQPYTIETKLHIVSEALKGVVKESSPLGLTDLEEAKRDFPALFGVEKKQATTITEAKKPVTLHNGASENGHGTVTETNTRKDIFAAGDRVLIESDFKRGKITAEQRRMLLGEKPAAYATLTEGQKREFDMARLFNFSESDALHLAKL